MELKFIAGSAVCWFTDPVSYSMFARCSPERPFPQQYPMVVTDRGFSTAVLIFVMVDKRSQLEN